MQASLQAFPQAQAALPVADGLGAEAARLLHQARNAAFAEASRGRLGQGLSLLHRALDIEPMSHDLRSDIAALMLAAGELNSAAEYAQHALAIRPSHGPSLYTLAFAMVGLGDLVQARDLLLLLSRGEALASLQQEAPDLLPLVRTELARLEDLAQRAAAELAAQQQSLD